MAARAAMAGGAAKAGGAARAGGAAMATGAAMAAIMLFKKNRHNQFGIKIITMPRWAVYFIFIWSDKNELQNNGLRKIR